MSDEKTNPIAGESAANVDVASIAARHQPDSTQPRKGRPKGVRLPDGSWVSKEELASRLGSVSSASPKVDQPQAVDNGLSNVAKEQIVAAVASLYKVVDMRVQDRVKQTALRLMPDDPKFAGELTQRVAMGELQQETMTSLTVVVMEKYNILGTYAPEALLGICLLGYSYTVYSVLSDLKQMQREMEHGFHASTKTATGDGTERNRQD